MQMGIKNGERISMEIIASIKSKIRLKKWGYIVFVFAVL